MHMSRDLQVRVPEETHRVAALTALRYQEADHRLDPAAIAEISALLDALGDAQRQELLDAVISLGSVAVMLHKLGDTAAHDAVMDIIRQQAHRFEDAEALLEKATAAFATRAP